jgi:hypothetical protein
MVIAWRAILEFAVSRLVASAVALRGGQWASGADQPVKGWGFRMPLTEPGVHLAICTVENCVNTLILRCSASEHGGTAQSASKLIGEREVIHEHISRGVWRGSDPAIDNR